MKELQSNISTLILIADKGRSAVIVNCEDYLKKCMNHIKNGPYQLLKKYQNQRHDIETIKGCEGPTSSLIKNYIII